MEYLLKDNKVECVNYHVCFLQFYPDRFVVKVSCRNIYRYVFLDTTKDKRKHNRVFPKRLQLDRSVLRKSVQCWLCQPGTDQVTVSMSSYVFIEPAQRTCQRVIEWMERKTYFRVVLAQNPLSFCSLVADVMFKVSALRDNSRSKSCFSEFT